MRCDCAILIQSLFFSHYYYIKIVTLTCTTTLMWIIALLGGGGWIWGELTSNSIMWEHWMVLRFCFIHLLHWMVLGICFIHLLHWMVLGFASSTNYNGWVLRFASSTKYIESLKLLEIGFEHPKRVIKLSPINWWTFNVQSGWKMAKEEEWRKLKEVCPSCFLITNTP